MANTVLSVLGDFMTLLVGIGFLFYVHWPLALLAVCVLPPLVVLFARLRTSLKEDFKESQEKSALVSRYLAESLSNVLTIKLFSLEVSAKKKFAAVMIDVIRKNFAILRKRIVYENAIALLTGIVPVGILWIAAFEISHGRLSVGEFIAFTGFLAYLYRPAESIVIALLSMQSSISAVERVFEILDTEKEVDLPSPAPRGGRRVATSVAASAGAKAVELRGVSFRYPGQREWVLRDLDLEVRVPPLRSRKEDIPALVRAFITKHCQRFGRKVFLAGDARCQECGWPRGGNCATEAFFDALEGYDWPGNVRELEGLIASLVATVPDDVLRAEHLPQHIRARRASKPAGESEEDLRLDSAVRSHIERVIALADNNQSRAAQMLGLPLSTMRNKMKKLGMSPPGR